MAIPLHHSFVLGPFTTCNREKTPVAPSPRTPNTSTTTTATTSATTTTPAAALERRDDADEMNQQTQTTSPVVSPKKQQEQQQEQPSSSSSSPHHRHINHYPGLTIRRNKSLTGPPPWSRLGGSRAGIIRQPFLLRKILSTGDPSSPICGIDEAFLRKEFEPPVPDQDYWKNRCFKFQSYYQTARRKIRDMEEDKRQLRKRIYELEERLTYQTNAAATTTMPNITTTVNHTTTTTTTAAGGCCCSSSRTRRNSGTTYFFLFHCHSHLFLLLSCRSISIIIIISSSSSSMIGI